MAVAVGGDFFVCGRWFDDMKKMIFMAVANEFEKSHQTTHSERWKKQICVLRGKPKLC